MEKLIYTIRWIINSKGLKQKAVAERMGITDKKLSEMLNGRKKIYFEDIQKFCSALNVTPNELFGIEKKRVS